MRPLGHLFRFQSRRPTACYTSPRSMGLHNGKRRTACAAPSRDRSCPGSCTFPRSGILTIFESGNHLRWRRTASGSLVSFVLRSRAQCMIEVCPRESGRHQPSIFHLAISTLTLTLKSALVSMIHTKSRLKKSPTSLSVEGPPMLRKTMAVGPLEPVASCVTGWTGVARFLAWLLSCETRGAAALLDSPLENCCVVSLNAMLRCKDWVVKERKFGAWREE